jgi:hypothetical protein
MLRQKLKSALEPVRTIGRRFLMMPTLEEQQNVSFRGCLFTATSFATRNYVAGDYLEFGVWKGNSFVKAYHSLAKNRREHLDWLARHRTYESAGGKATSEFELWRQWQTRFFAFDSFEGLPATEGQQMHEEWVAGSYQCSEDGFRANIAADGVDLKEVVTVRGFYDKSLTAETKTRHNLRRAAVVHIDCDLYESTAVVLSFITDLVVQGTILIFDDWFFNQGRPDCGEQRACREWLAANPQLELIEYWREPRPMSFIVNFKR